MGPGSNTEMIATLDVLHEGSSSNGATPPDKASEPAAINKGQTMPNTVTADSGLLPKSLATIALRPDNSAGWRLQVERADGTVVVILFPSGSDSAQWLITYLEDGLHILPANSPEVFRQLFLGLLTPSG